MKDKSQDRKYIVKHFYYKAPTEEGGFYRVAVYTGIVTRTYDPHLPTGGYEWIRLPGASVPLDFATTDEAKAAIEAHKKAEAAMVGELLSIEVNLEE